MYVARTIKDKITRQKLNLKLKSLKFFKFKKQQFIGLSQNRIFTQ